MKTNINQESKSAKHNGYANESLSVKDAFIWFVITVAALCIAGTSQAQSTIVKKDSPVKISH
ncbi:MAG: hypothetical protein V4685_00620 [Bacteroidota bacterium]